MRKGEANVYPRYSAIFRVIPLNIITVYLDTLKGEVIVSLI